MNAFSLTARHRPPAQATAVQRPFHADKMAGTLPPVLGGSTLDILAAGFTALGVQQRLPEPWQKAPRSAVSSPRLVILDDVRAAARVWNPIAKELAEGLEQRGIPVCYGQFNGIPGIIRSRSGQAWPLLELDAMRDYCIVLVFTDSQGLRNTRQASVIRQFARWPWLVWLELREMAHWDAASAALGKLGVAVHPASADGLREVLGYLQAGHTGVRAADTWQGPRAESGSRSFSASVARILGDAQSWAQACAMLPPPLSLGLACHLREHFFPHLPTNSIGRLWSLPEIRQQGSGLVFSPRLLALLRSGFACQDLQVQEAILRFLLAQVERFQPAAGSFAHQQWQWYHARLELELDPDAALPRLHKLAALPTLDAHAKLDMAQVVLPVKAGAGSTARIPLRRRPSSHANLRRLLALAPDCGSAYAELHPLLFRLGYGWDTLLHHLRSPRTVAQISPDGRYILSISSNQRARLWLPGAEDSIELPCDDECLGQRTSSWRRKLLPGKLLCAFYPDASRVVTVTDNSCMRIWDLSSYEATYILKHHALSLRGLVVGNDEQILGISGDGQVWDLMKGKPSVRLNSHARMINHLALSPNGKWLLTTSADGTARLWEAHSGQLLRVMRGHSASIDSAAFAPDGQRIVTASRDGCARLWETHSGRTLDVLTGHRGGVSAVAFSADGRYLATASRGGSAYLWAINGGKVLQVFDTQGSAVTSLGFAQDSLITAADNGSIRLWTT